MRERIEAQPLFAGLTDARLDELAAVASERLAAPGEVLVERGQPASGLFVLEEGRVLVEVPAASGVELGPGDVFGELAAREWAARFSFPRLATVVAASPLRLYVLPNGELDRLAEAFPEIDDELGFLTRERLPRH